MPNNKQLSPLKRTKNSDSATSLDESPKKRARQNILMQSNDGPLSQTPKYENKGSLSLCVQVERKHSRYKLYKICKKTRADKGLSPVNETVLTHLIKKKIIEFYLFKHAEIRTTPQSIEPSGSVK